MEIEDQNFNQDYKYNNNYYYNNNTNLIHNLFINAKNYIKKRNYNESLTSSEKIIIKEKELKYFLSLVNQLKLKVDSSNNFITKKYEEKEKNSEKKLPKSKSDIKLDFSIIDLNDIIFQLYQSNNISEELKIFILKKIVDNAIKVERTFQNFFNLNNMPNKK